jgi:type VI secretion system protein ImpG
MARGTRLFSKPVRGVPCQFTTTQDVTIWPAEIGSASMQDPEQQVNGAQQVLTIGMKTFNEVPVSEIAWDRVRFFLQGQHQHIFRLYELLFNHVCHVECEAAGPDGRVVRIPLPNHAIRPVGFAREETIMPRLKRSFPGYFLLFEYFAFPEKFLFFDLVGLDRMAGRDLGDTMRIRIYLDTTPKERLPIDRSTFQLNAAPAINLFTRIAEPIRVEYRKPDYPVIPDIRRQEATEVFSVDRVTAVSAGKVEKTIEFKPFYAIRHHLGEGGGETRRAYWHLKRRFSSKKGDGGTDMFISFTDPELQPADPGVEILTAHVTCTNRDLPGRLPFGDTDGDFNLETAAPVARVGSLIKPTATRRPFLAGALQWRLISHLSLNYMSLVDGGEAALKEILSLYDFENSPATRQQIQGVAKLASRYVTKRVGQSFCRGIETTITLDEEKYVGAGLFLFSAVLERFLGQYVSVNSFSQLVVKTLQRKDIVKRWPPRSGEDILL